LELGRALRQSDRENVDVSVVLVTYNHAPYIERAVASVLAQNTSRAFELIISEDASTDGTREIVEEIGTSDSRIRLLLSERNLRSNATISRGLKAARGRYVCLLDGDDYWTSTDKLERQAELLDAHREISACFHNALVIRGSDQEPSADRWTPAHCPERLTAQQLWEGNPFATAAGMLRLHALREIGRWYDQCFPITDWPLYLLCAEAGDLMFVDEPVAAYRVHEGGAVSGLPSSARLRLIADFYGRMTAAANGRWAAPARRGARRYFGAWVNEYRRLGQHDLARLCARLGLWVGGGPQRGWREWLRLARAAVS
jgi:glycosyltransferase involved in cell wall biosynthesis